MIRKAEMKDLDAVNELRRQVNELHVQGRPDIFKPGFGPELRDHALIYLTSENNEIFVDEEEGRLAGVIMGDYFSKPETPYSMARDFCHIAEICVDRDFRRQGIAHRLMAHAKEEAKKRGLTRIELDVWAFNDAIRFYEAEGFRTFRTFFEMEL